MAWVLIDDQYLDDIADAIRAKNGSQATYTPAQMDDAIAAIQTGYDIDQVRKLLSKKLTYFEYPDDPTLTDSADLAVKDSIFCEQYQMTYCKIPSNYTNIQNRAFYNSTNLESVTTIDGEFPDSIRQIGTYSFFNTKLNWSRLPSSLAWLQEGAFKDCKYITVSSVPSDYLLVSAIAKETFYGCTSITSMTLPSRITSIQNGAFQGCNSMTTFSAPNVTSVWDYAFYNCTSLANLSLPSLSNEIHDHAFENCPITWQSIPSGVYKIDYRAFANTNITINSVPSSVTTLGQECFSGCSGITEFEFASDATCSLYQEVFKNCTSLVKFKALGTSVQSQYTGSKMFTGCTSLKEVRIPRSNFNVYEGCTALELLDINPAQSFNLKDCQSLKTLIIRSNTTRSASNENLRQDASDPIDVYVPSTLISTYQNMTTTIGNNSISWKDLYDNGYVVFHALEGSIYEQPDWTEPTV